MNDTRYLRRKLLFLRHLVSNFSELIRIITLQNVCAVLWRVCSTLGDTIISTLGEAISTVEDIQYSGANSKHCGYFFHSACGSLHFTEYSPQN